MCNILQGIPREGSSTFENNLKTFYVLHILTLARRAKNELVSSFGDKQRYEKAYNVLDEGSEDAFQYTIIGNVHSHL